MKHTFINRIFEKWNGIDTDKSINLTDLGYNEASFAPYHATPWRVAFRILRLVKPVVSDVIVDFGCGKGRMVYLFAKKKQFQKIIGVDVANELLLQAQQNIISNTDKLKCKNVEFVCSDAVKYPVPSNMTFAFFFNPFWGDVFEKVISNIYQSYLANPRKIKIIYYNPLMEQYMASLKWLHLIHDNARLKIYETD